MLTDIVLYGKGSSECGYCKSGSPSGSVSFGITSSTMTAEQYETLMLRGWRRSGSYFYKPMLHETCCPPYTIRLEASRFAMSKSQRKVLRKCPEGQITITTERSSFSDEKFDLYKRYQVEVHKDDPNELSPASFSRFLVESPLNHAPLMQQGDLSRGTFHQLYRLNGVLIAVGVVDVLPSGLSSVYCFYDPTLRSLVLGKYTALKEIEYSRENGLRYYYMGFYIHGCEKMRYKAEYAPSELQCPVTCNWYPLEQCIPLLDQFPFTPLDPAEAEKRKTVGNDQLAALFPRRHKPGDENSLCLHIDGVGDFTVDRLTPSSRRLVARILSDLIQWTGLDMAKSFRIGIS